MLIAISNEFCNFVVTNKIIYGPLYTLYNMKNRLLPYLCLMMICGWWPLKMDAATMQQMRFHCANDTTEINALLDKGLKSGKKSANELVSFYAHELLNRPYVAHTLEGEKEMLTINIDELDCTTFVETLYALTRTTLNERYSWRDFANNLEDIRYRGGKMDGYASRLHYISEWTVDNTSRGNIEEITKDVKGAKELIKTINYMTTHRDAYPALKDSVTFEKMKSYEEGYRNHKTYYLRKEHLNGKDVCGAVQEGDLVGLVCKTPGLDISHMGMVVKNEKGELVVIDASMSAGKVVKEPRSIVEYLRPKKGVIGIRVFRIKK